MKYPCLSTSQLHNRCSCLLISQDGKVNENVDMRRGILKHLYHPRTVNCKTWDTMDEKANVGVTCLHEINVATANLALSIVLNYFQSSN